MHRFTFPKKEHLQKKWEFQRVFDENKKYEGQYLILYLLADQPDRKIGIIVSKKTGNAVKRNRARRLIREAYRLNKNILSSDIHIVISAKPEINGLKYKDVEQDLLNLYKKAFIGLSS